MPQQSKIQKLIVLFSIIILSGCEASYTITIDKNNINEIIKNKRGINVKYAQSFEALFGVPTMIWLMWRNIDELNNEK